MTVLDRVSKRDQLQSQGYLAIDQVGSAADIKLVRDTLQRLWQDRTGYDRGALFDFVGSEDGNVISFPQILRPSDMASELCKTEFFGNALALARELLGPEARFAADHALIKPAHKGPATPWHQDDAFRDPAMDGHEISIWLALQDVGLHNGCMQFIPGSHKIGVLPHRSPGGNGRVHALECFEGFDPGDAVPCPLPAGGVTVHTGRTLHYAGPNPTNEHRMVYVLIFDKPPTPAVVPREAPWLLERSTARDAREKSWLRRGGILIHVWQRLRRLDLRQPGHLVFLARRAFISIGRLTKRSITGRRTS